MKILTQLKLDNSSLGVITQSSIKILIGFRYVLDFPIGIQIFSDLTNRMIGSETGRLLKCF